MHVCTDILMGYVDTIILNNNTSSYNNTAWIKEKVK